MPLKLKIIRISIYYLMYKHLYSTALNLDVAFVFSVSICMQIFLNQIKVNTILLPKMVSIFFFSYHPCVENSIFRF